MDAPLQAKLFAAAAELHPAVLAFIALSVTLFFRRAIPSLGVLGARWQAMVLHATASVAAPPRGSASNFFALCVATGALLHADQLVSAAADLGLNPGVVACVAVAVVAIFNRNIFSLNALVAREPSKREPNMLLRRAAASPVGSAHLTRPAFVVLAGVVSASWFAESFAAQLGLSSAANAAAVMLFAALFNVSIHLFLSCF